MKNSLKEQLVILLMTTLTFACSGDKTFNDYARAGDTIAVAAGWKQNFNKENITITITPSIGSIITILPGDPAIRASLNFYADPLSSAIVSRETGLDLSTYARLYEGVITANYTKDDKDWYESTVFIDLPPTLPTGTTQIEVTNSQGASVIAMVEIIDGVGSPSTLTAQNNTNLTPAMLDALTRVEHYTVDVTGTTLPYAVELTLMHDPDQSSGGTGVPYAINPLGYKKNLIWNDDGVTMKVILTPANTTRLMDHFNDYKFYVAGNVQNLVVSSVNAYDLNGNVVAGVSSTSTLGR